MTKARSEKIWKYSDITGEWVCYPARERSVQYPGRVFAQRATSGSPVLAIAMSLRSALSYRHYYSDDHPSTTYVIPQSFKTRATKYPVCALHALCVIKHCTCSTAIGQAKPAHLGLRYLSSVKNERCTPTCLLRIHRRRLAAPPIYWPDRLYRAYEPINWRDGQPAPMDLPVFDKTWSLHRDFEQAGVADLFLFEHVAHDHGPVLDGLFALAFDTEPVEQAMLRGPVFTLRQHG